MRQIPRKTIALYVEQNIPEFHRNRIEKLKKLKLTAVLKRKNPYLFKVKHITTARNFIQTILDAYLSSQEETLFGAFLEGLAVYVCGYVYHGSKSSAEGIDLEFEKDSAKYIVSVKSGPNWGNSSQIKRMKDNFRKAKKILGTNTASSPNVIAVNGCCYGKETHAACGLNYHNHESNNPNHFQTGFKRKLPLPLLDVYSCMHWPLKTTSSLFAKRVLHLKDITDGANTSLYLW
jgi:hypothetical protein